MAALHDNPYGEGVSRMKTAIMLVALLCGCLPPAPAALPPDVAAEERPRILQAAAAALKQPPLTITKYRAPLSEGGPNDYYSNGDYWWPNPNTSNGLPYIRRDGYSNPANFNAHRRCLHELHEAVAALGAAYQITGDDRYVTKAVELLRVFFLDPKTRMNPNLQFAQAIPGVSPGRGIGIIDTLHLIEVPRAIEAMEKSPAFPPEVLAGLKKWFADYLHWMQTSKNGREEANAKNNHAVAFWLQVAVFAQFTGDEAALAECRRRFQEVFLPDQMALDGSFPRELARTKPYGYSIFQLDNLATLCQVLSTATNDLWTFTLPDGRGMKRAMEFLYPYLADKNKWLADGHSKDVQAWNGWPRQEPCLLFAGLAYHEPKYLNLWKSLSADVSNPEVRRNTAITQPVLWFPFSADPPPNSSAVSSGDFPRPAEIRTPPAPHTPRINGPDVFGVRPDHPFLYHIPATGDRPMTFSADGLPAGLQLDPQSGQITGMLSRPGDYRVTLRAQNALGEDQKKFRIIVGETIALTPPMGWNSWNHYAGRVNQAIVLANAQAMVSSGLINYGWTYVNIDDTWQGRRGGPFHAIQPNEKFPDMKKLCDAVHALGLKIGIYSTPWTTSYANHVGGSSENPDGAWSPPTIPKRGHLNKKELPWAIGPYHFATHDAAQWAAWGVDYLKYDWNPIEYPETKEMYDALRHCGRDIVFSLSNNLNITNAPAVTPLANCWRTTGDIKANWHSMITHGFDQEKWRRFCRPGHWNDPDMLEIANAERGQPGLTPDEEYTHLTLWCLDSAPLLLGNDLTRLDAFTLNLLENAEVLAVDQDALGQPGVCVARGEDWRVYAKPLQDGSIAVGLFNTGTNGTLTVTAKWSDLKISGEHIVRDLWRQKDLGKFRNEFSMPVAPHSAELVKIELVKPASSSTGERPG